MSLPYLKRKTRQMADLSRKITVDLSNERVGIASTIPVSTLDIGIDVDSTGLTGNLTGIAGTASSLNPSVTTYTFTGNVSASKFVGFGSALTGVGYTTVAVIFDRKASSVDGGTFTSGAWRTRDLNHIESDPDNIVSISNNQFTLQHGTYNIEWMAQTSSVEQHRSRLWNATDSVAVTFGDGTGTSEGGVCCNKYGYNHATPVSYNRSRGSVAKLNIPKSNTPINPTTWTAASASEANEWQAITYGNGKFVAVSKTGTNRIMYSYNGSSWTAQVATSASSWRAITYGNDDFVAVGGASVMYASDSDLTSWTDSTMSESNSWRGIAYGNGKFVAVSSNGTNRVGYASDSDLTSWTAVAAAEDNAWRAITYGNGKFVAVAATGTNRVMYASDSDLTSWTAVAAAEDNTWRGITYGNGKFVAVAANGTNRVMYSTDGINWSNSGLSGVPTNAWRSVTYGNGKFVAVSGTNKVMYSSDGINWTTTPTTEANSWLGITSGNGKFVAVSEDGTNQVMYNTYINQKAFEIGHICNNTKATNGFGVKTNDSAYDSYNYYTMVVIYKGG